MIYSHNMNTDLKSLITAKKYRPPHQLLKQIHFSGHQTAHCPLASFEGTVAVDIRYMFMVDEYLFSIKLNESLLTIHKV